MNTNVFSGWVDHWVTNTPSEVTARYTLRLDGEATKAFDDELLVDSYWFEAEPKVGPAVVYHCDHASEEVGQNKDIGVVSLELHEPGRVPRAWTSMTGDLDPNAAHPFPQTEPDLSSGELFDSEVLLEVWGGADSDWDEALRSGWTWRSVHVLSADRSSIVLLAGMPAISIAETADKALERLQGQVQSETIFAEVYDLGIVRMAPGTDVFRSTRRHHS